MTELSVLGVKKGDENVDYWINIGPWKLLSLLEKSLKSPWILFVWSCTNHGKKKEKDYYYSKKVIKKYKNRPFKTKF